MHKYEMTIIVKPNLDEEATKLECSQVVELIERFGGVIDKIDDVGKRRLAYEIQKVTEGYYNFITFTSEAGAPAEIEARLRLRENLLRFLIIRIEE
ncbi:MAG: 30S ribosomal protein S6 [Defluviitaleaceae bacterium]|nr:30S ribosomal protein S6 [Defluviitaleaceae bacterium]